MNHHSLPYVCSKFIASSPRCWLIGAVSFLANYLIAAIICRLLRLSQVFSVGDGPIIKPATCLKEHCGHMIVSLGSAFQSRRGTWADDVGCELVSCDECGDICVWEAQQADTYFCRQKIQGGIPCSGLAVRHGFIIAARTDGIIRIYALVSADSGSCSEQE